MAAPEQPWSGDRYGIAAWLFTRFLGACYFFAFVSLCSDVRGLIGERGILPAGELLEALGRRAGAERFLYFPTLFWWGSGDAQLSAACFLGAAISLLFVFGFANVLSASVLWGLYLSLQTVGREFLSFQWDTLLLEAGFLTIFLVPGRRLWSLGTARPPSRVMVALYRWLLFRLMFMSGAVKLKSGDPTWSGLTALSYHYETQPLPTVIGYYAHLLPDEIHAISTAAVLVIELAVPFLIFAPKILRRLCFVPFALLQLLIILTGNYTFFNVLTIALSLFLLDDGLLSRAPGLRWIRVSGESTIRIRRREMVLASVIALLSLVELSTGRRPLPEPVAWIRSWHVVNSYGLFAVMTTTRNEISIEGSADGELFEPYEFKWKPDRPERPPLWIAPLQPRLDWQMWFAALTPCAYNAWFARLQARLLEGSPEVEALFEKVPSARPIEIRTRIATYRFSTPEELAAKGHWWSITEHDEYCPNVRLQRLAG